MFKYVSFSTEVIIEKEITSEQINIGNISSYQIEKYKQRYLNNGLSETDLQVFIMKDARVSPAIARTICHEVRLQIKTR